MNSSVDSFANFNVTPRPVLPDDESNIPRHRISNSSSTDKIPAPPTRRESIASQSLGSQSQGEGRRVLGDSLPRKVSRKASESSHQRGGVFSASSSSSSRGGRRYGVRRQIRVSDFGWCVNSECSTQLTHDLTHRECIIGLDQSI